MKKDLKTLANELPLSPGVYLFLNEASKVLYIGKANSLRKRVSDYFHEGRDKRYQIPKLLEQAKKLHFLVTPNEREALLLENNLIKQNHPPFNICLKDDKTYKSVLIASNHPYPRIGTVRKVKREKGNLHFGPYCSGQDLRTTLQQLVKFFLLRDCTDAEFKRRKTPCMKYQIHLCSAPCVNKISKTDYQKSVKEAIAFLQGRNKTVFRFLKEKIAHCSAQLKFEQASEYHLRLEALKRLLNTQTLLSGFYANGDAIAFQKTFQKKETTLLFQILNLRSGNIIRSSTHVFKEKHGQDAELLRVFLEQYYTSHENIPQEIWVFSAPENKDLLQEILSTRRGAPCRIIVPRKGGKWKALCLAFENATIQLNHRFSEQSKNQRLEKSFQEIFQIKTSIRHIECYDISHQSGKDIVGVKVSFRDFKPCKKDYRKYIIRSVSNSDDCRSLLELLRRRLQTPDLPDLFLVDGGLGQLKALERALAEANVKAVVAAIAKESHAKHSFDRVFVSQRKNPLSLKRAHPVLLKMMEMRDEAHRFALAFHRHKKTERVLQKIGTVTEQ